MKDASIFEGIKELGNLRFEQNGITWRVFEEVDEGYYFICEIERLEKESNLDLFERATKTINYYI